MHITEEEYESFLENWSEWQRQLRLEATQEIDDNFERQPKRRRSFSLRRSFTKLS